uniref:ribonucleoside-diphosphate reductase n=1 Tax=viral metagenome TaxID=1070528 RepID=A0A6C0D9I3_9ZZZZ
MSSEQDSQREMRVTKRDGSVEDISFDKILNRVKKLGQEANIHINYSSLVMKVIDQLYDKISTTKIDELTAEQCAALSTQHPDYGVLAGRIVVSNHQKNTNAHFSSVMGELYNFKDIHGDQKPLISEDLFNISIEMGNYIQPMLDYSRDYLIDYFGFKTLERAYLFKVNNKIVERPQHMWMRVAIGIHGKDMKAVKETYDLMSQKYFTHATPTLFNAGTPRPQLSSCYLIAMEDDSLDGIYNTLKDCATISKWAGGIGLHIHNVRAKGTHIQGTNGTSNGIVPMLRVFNDTARYIDQCLDPDTVVYTKRGAVKIKNIVVGDKVITDNGNYYKIGKILDNYYFGDMYILDIKHTLYPLKATDMHPLWTIKNDKYYQRNFNDVINQLERKLLVPEFIEVKNIDKNDFVGFPIPKYEKDIYQFNEEDCRFYGIMLGDGNISNVNNLAYVALNKLTKSDTIEFVENYLQSKNIHITYTYKNDAYVRLTWTRNNMFKFTYEMLYDSNKEKYVLPSMLHLPKNKILNLIKGILETDGNVKDYQITLEITSCNIVESLRYMLMRLGILTSGTIRNRIGNGHVSKYGSYIETKKLSYILIIPKKPIICDLFKNKNISPSDTFTFFEYKDYLFSIVNKNSLIKDYSGRVIDIEVDNNDHHNFLTHNGLVKNGGGKRNGSFAIYLEPWHPDVEYFLEMKKNHGDEEMKARDLFYALWIPDLFMERVKENRSWSLFCPHECPGLADVYGSKFNELYEKYESTGKQRRTVSARELWFKILDAQMETGTPYILYKDAANKKSNQQNLGTIKSSNLCTEILQYSDDKETAVCNLASIALPAFVNKNTKEFDYEKLHEVTKVVTSNLNRVIDINFYPTEKTRRSNLLHRPIGIGVQGLADTFILMDIAYHSEEAKQINKNIFETIYHAALERSNEIAYDIKQKYLMDNHYSGSENVTIVSELSLKHTLSLRHFGAYKSFRGSPASKGVLQFDMWNVTPSDRYDWSQLKESIIDHGLRNSLLVAPMPTASTSQILGYNECFEPLTSNIYSRRTLAGEFVVANSYLMRELIELGIWNDKIKNNIIANKGSIQQLTIIPEHIRNKYKIVWEMPMKHLIDMSADRGAYVCQSQSLNLWLEDPNYNTLTSMHFYSWKQGLKTGIYYLRRKAKHQAQQFTVEPEKNEEESDVKLETDEPDICEMCSA